MAHLNHVSDGGEAVKTNNKTHTKNHYKSV